ncbi:MAG: hypothetical protein AAGG02_20775 [Cyanobacteria bacterium P01_H01_bin.15]
MLVQLVRPLVRSQIQMLAQLPAVDSKLAGMVAQWLGYLGVHAEVIRLETSGKQIEVSLKVSKPEQCSEREWQQILGNLTCQNNFQEAEAAGLTYEVMTSAQQSKVHRLLACVLQASNGNLLDDWSEIQLQLAEIGIVGKLLAELRSAVRVVTPMELLVKGLEPEVASFALSKAIAIALMDKQINQAEDGALKTLLDALQQPKT